MMQDAIFVLLSSKEKDFCSLCFEFAPTCNPENKKQEMTLGKNWTFHLISDFFPLAQISCFGKIEVK